MKAILASPIAVAPIPAVSNGNGPIGEPPMKTPPNALRSYPDFCTIKELTA
jgi:hypothetical protein